MAAIIKNEAMKNNNLVMVFKQIASKQNYKLNFSKSETKKLLYYFNYFTDFKERILSSGHFSKYWRILSRASSLPKIFIIWL